MNLETNSYKTEPLTMSVSELANYLKISRQSAYKLCHREGFPSIRISQKRILVLRNKLWAWLETQAEKPLRGKA